VTNNGSEDGDNTGDLEKSTAQPIAPATAAYDRGKTVTIKPSISNLAAISALRDTFKASSLAASVLQPSISNLTAISALRDTFKASSLAASVLQPSISNLTAISALRDTFKASSLAASVLQPSISNLTAISALRDTFKASSLAAASVLKPIAPTLFDSPCYSAFSTIRNSLKDIVESSQKYQLPQVAEVQNAFDAYQSDYAASFKGAELKSYLLDSLSASMERMQMPALDIVSAGTSIKGLLDVHRIASAIDSFPAYGVKAEALLRKELGDWRDVHSWPQKIFEREVDRATFYVDHGLDQSLTAFSPEAFEALAESSGLQTETRSLAQLFGDPVPIDGIDQDGLKRSTEACRYLIGFERYIRMVIDEAMTEEFDTDWPRHQLPNGLFDKWTDKKEKAERSGGPPLRVIEYADFTDYVDVITRKDNWRRVFAAVFRTHEGIRESFQRLQPVRVCAMHSRLLTNDDMLFLYVEIKRITNAFKKK
jgi:hypothetical protein